MGQLYGGSGRHPDERNRCTSQVGQGHGKPHYTIRRVGGRKDLYFSFLHGFVPISGSQTSLAYSLALPIATQSR
jgi:hypothetical protein